MRLFGYGKSQFAKNTEMIRYSLRDIATRLEEKRYRAAAKLSESAARQVGATPARLDYKHLEKTDDRILSLIDEIFEDIREDKRVRLHFRVSMLFILVVLIRNDSETSEKSGALDGLLRMTGVCEIASELLLQLAELDKCQKEILRTGRDIADESFDSPKLDDLQSKYMENKKRMDHISTVLQEATGEYNALARSLNDSLGREVYCELSYSDIYDASAFMRAIERGVAMLARLSDTEEYPGPYDPPPTAGGDEPDSLADYFSDPMGSVSSDDTPASSLWFD